jgi:Fe-S oxidoreductase
MEEKIGKRINIERAEEAIAVGVGDIAAACPYCITMLRDGIADLNGRIAVRDIAEIIDEVTS